MQTIPVFFAADNNYSPYLSVAVSSLYLNASKKYGYEIYVLNTGISAENADKLKRLQRRNFNINFVDVTKSLESVGELKLRDYYTRATYYRLFIADMFTQLDKAVYLDGDIVVTGDISELYNVNLGGSLVGGIPDQTVDAVPEFRRYVLNALGILPERYFNAGVLVMNLAQMRKQRFFDSFAALLSKYKFAVAQDQDYLNVLCRGKVTYISGEWNKMPIPSVNAQTPKLIHYNLTRKPWRYENVLYAEYFWRYARGSEFYSDILNEFNSFDSARAAADSECEKRLIALAASEADSAFNYYNKFIA